MKPGAARVGLLLLIAALTLRAGWVLYRWHADGPDAALYPDEELHWQLASNLVERGEMVSDDGRYAVRMPVYPLFLAAFASIGHYGILAARLGQALVGALATYLAYRFARTALGPRPALFAGLLVCCDPFTVFLCNTLLTEAVFTPILLALTTCAWYVVRRADRTPLLMLVGVAVLGPILMMTRASAAGLVLVLWIVLWIAEPDRWRGTVRLMFYAATLFVLMLPWGLRNRAVIGSCAWLSTNGGHTLYDAQGPQADGSSDQTFLKELPELVGLGEAERDQTLQRLAIEQMRADPARVLRLAWAKFKRTWNLIPNVAEHSEGTSAAISAAFMACVLVTAAIGVYRSVKRRQLLRFHLVLWLPVLYFTLLHCIYIGSVRYRVPLMPLLELAAAAALTWSTARACTHDQPAAK